MTLAKSISVLAIGFALATANAQVAPPVGTPTKPFRARRAIYCSGTRGAFVYSRVESLCIDVRHAKAYWLSIYGVGQSYQIAGTIFRLAIDYDVDRYDANFDPFPGQYYAVVVGATLGPGLAQIDAFAGNKTIRGYAYNVGLGVDFTLASLMVIQ